MLTFSKHKGTRVPLCLLKISIKEHVFLYAYHLFLYAYIVPLRLLFGSTPFVPLCLSCSFMLIFLDSMKISIKEHGKHKGNSSIKYV